MVAANDGSAFLGADRQCLGTAGSRDHELSLRITHAETATSQVSRMLSTTPRSASLLLMQAARAIGIGVRIKEVRHADR